MRSTSARPVRDASCKAFIWRNHECACILTRSDARLEAEGVHGDGWEAGVERTRGGPSSAGKRATVMEPSKGTNLGEDEREFLASLDRYVDVGSGCTAALVLCVCHSSGQLSWCWCWRLSQTDPAR
jgi:hypothetical protein